MVTSATSLVWITLFASAIVRTLAHSQWVRQQQTDRSFRLHLTAVKTTTSSREINTLRALALSPPDCSSAAAPSITQYDPLVEADLMCREYMFTDAISGLMSLTMGLSDTSLSSESGWVQKSHGSTICHLLQHAGSHLVIVSKVYIPTTHSLRTCALPAYPCHSMHQPHTHR